MAESGGGRPGPGWRKGPRVPEGGGGPEPGARSTVSDLCRKLCSVHCEKQSDLLKKATALQTTSEQVRYNQNKNRLGNTVPFWWHKGDTLHY